ncbi:hypothetical protein HI113_13935 [Corallococcus exiguus]|nr:hypothetical protein [Corallococcus exiguus]
MSDEQVGVATVDRLIGRWKRTGSLVPKRPGPRPFFRIPDSQLGKVKRLLDAAPDSTTQEIANAYVKQTGVGVSRATMGRAFRRLGYTRKKVTPRLRAAAGEESPRPQAVFGYGRRTEAREPPLHRRDCRDPHHDASVWACSTRAVRSRLRAPGPSSTSHDDRRPDAPRRGAGTDFRERYQQRPFRNLRS